MSMSHREIEKEIQYYGFSNFLRVYKIDRAIAVDGDNLIDYANIHYCCRLQGINAKNRKKYYNPEWNTEQVEKKPEPHWF